MKNQIDILLVEDSPSDIRLTEEALKDSGLGFRLSTAGDGEEAMSFLRNTKNNTPNPRPDIILLDLNMPKKNGHEVLAEIKQNPDLSSIPVVLLTVSQRDYDVLEALRLKMNYYLAKPIDAEKLTTLIKAIFELHEQVPPPSEYYHSSEDLHVRLVLSSNPHTAPSVLKKLATEGDGRIRARVAENPSTPQEVLFKLGCDKDPEVRLGVAENPNAPKAVLELLSHDTSDDVRLGLAENPRMPQTILQTLARDENIFVSTCANKTLATKP